jgi:hypothetical protein
VLVDHPDTSGDRITWILELQPLAVDEDLSLVGVVEAVEDVHERRLARPVLAEQAVDLTRLDDEVDGVVGDHPGEALGDAPQFELHANLLTADRQRNRGTRCPAVVPGTLNRARTLARRGR